MNSENNTIQNDEADFIMLPEWNSKVLRPIVLDCLRLTPSGSTFHLKIHKQFTDLTDSAGNSIIHQDKGYFFSILTNPEYRNYARSWSNLMLTEKHDTAYLSIDADSLFEFRDTIEWRAGYELLFSIENLDSIYVSSGTWIK